MIHNLLVIDYDYFFPNPMDGGDIKGRRDAMLYDWGHAETPFFVDMAWGFRATGFIRNGFDLPGLTGEQNGFWDRFTFAPRTKLFYADSNAYALSRHVLGPRMRYDSVWLYDAHHDGGYDGWQKKNLRRTRVGQLIRNGDFRCDNWMVVYSVSGASLHVRYPTWKSKAIELEPTPLVPMDRQVDDGTSPPVVFTRVFVCRSGAWVPPWRNLDATFLGFIDQAPMRSKTAVQEVPVREFDLEMMTLNAEQERIALEQFRRGLESA